MSNDQGPGWNGPDSEDLDEPRTVFVPTPGRGRRQQSPPAPPSAPPPAPTPDNAFRDDRPLRAPRASRPPAAIPGTGINPLVAVASPLLTLIATIQKTERLGDPAGLRERIERQMRALGTDTSRSQAAPETLKAASYCLCTAIDEAVLRTPWGAASDWRKLSLLRALHGDAWGGEKFFEILQHRMQDPGPNIDLLELLYICLALGFQGKYELLDDGKRKREIAIENLYDVIRRQRGDPEHDLSPHWQNEEAAKISLDHPLPLWVAGTVAAALLLITYVGFLFFLADSSEPTLDTLATFGKDAPAPVIEEPPPPALPAVAAESPGAGVVEPPPLRRADPIVPPPPPPEVDLAAELERFLKPEIDAGLVEVEDSSTLVRVRVTAPTGSSLFASGSDRVTAQFVPVIERIRVGVAERQADIPGDVIVEGHTDNIPITRSLRFQSNRDLSRARAQAVAEMLAAETEPRITSSVETRGKGADEPVDGSDPASGNRTAEQRAKNRRVEILIEK